MQAPNFSIVIPTYQRRALLEELLRALEQQNVPHDCFEVIVSVDGSEDGTAEMLESLHPPYALRWMLQPNRGRAAACNAGIRMARGEIVILLDDDMQPAPEFVSGHEAAHRAHPACGIIGAAPVVISESSSPSTRYIGTKFNGHLAKLARPGYSMRLRDFYSGNFSLPRALFERAGGFDESFIEYGNEDLELSERLSRMSVPIVFSPDALAWQRYTKDFAGLARDNLSKGRTAVLLGRKHPGVLRELKIGVPAEASLPWRIARASLLWATRLWPAVSGGVIRFMQLLERRRSRLFSTLCVAALDYFYWLGAREAMEGRPA